MCVSVSVCVYILTYGRHVFGSFTFEKKCSVHIIYVGGIVCGCVCLYFLKHMRAFLLVCVCVS